VFTVCSGGLGLLCGSDGYGELLLHSDSRLLTGDLSEASASLAPDQQWNEVADTCFIVRQEALPETLVDGAQGNDRCEFLRQLVAKVVGSIGCQGL
jgi:hypothetical protein